MNKIILGHAPIELKKLPDELVNCCVTSPPYWGLRDYDIESVIWDGDEDCEHDFDDIQRLHPTRGNRGQGVDKKYPNRNKRAVWTIPTQPFPESHFAVYPEKLIEPMIKAGCPKGGIVLDQFIGVGTTAVVAKKQGKRYIGIEIKQEYIDMANKRIKKIPELLF